MKIDLLNRNVNEGFSGGEKKRNEILQLAVGSYAPCYLFLLPPHYHNTEKEKIRNCVIIQVINVPIFWLLT